MTDGLECGSSPLVRALYRLGVVAFVGGVVLASGPSAALAQDTIYGALSRAYQASPVINAQRAGTRAIDENVPRALSGYRPRISANAEARRDWRQTTGLTGGSTASNGAQVGLSIEQTIYNGNRTANSVRQAETQVFGARYQLEAIVQDTLFNAAQIYMNVLRDTAILNLQRNNIDVLDEQLRQSRDRFEVGEVTRTDVAQAESRLASARSQVSLAEANLRANMARYRQIIGSQPQRLAPGRVPNALLPGNVEAALQIALSENPNIAAAQFNVDASALQVKIIEGEFLPTLGVSAGVSHGYTSGLPTGGHTTAAQVVARLSVPIYQAGEVSARARQARETMHQRRFEMEQVRDQVRAAVFAAWGSLEAARAQIQAAEVQVRAAETALTGVREEARVGQRTTLDVLNAQQELLNARVNIITAQRDSIVAAYAVIQAMGRLTPTRLGLAVETYDPAVHYNQVRDLIWGTKIPSGN